MNVLAFGAHGDDIEAFCAGTLARHARQGDKVVICVVTDGRGRPQGDPDEIVRIRKGEAQAAATIIGAELVWLAIPDGGLVVNQETRHQFIETIRAAEPDYIITHPPQDYHPDHTATSILTMEAAQVARTTNYPSKFAPVRKTVPVAFMAAEFGVDFVPEDYVDISDVWDVKVQMLMQHRSQHMPGPKFDANYVLPENPEDLGIVRASGIMSEFYGLSCGVRYAEPFRWWRAANRILPKRLLP
ncbi:MAG: PIG-L family deacetylase [Chloroflexota bacterium]